jgi:hypothetical protein
MALIGSLFILIGGKVDGNPEADYARQICSCTARLPPGLAHREDKGTPQEAESRQAEENYQDRLRSYCMAADALVIADRTLWVNRWGTVFTLFSVAFAVVGLLVAIATQRETIDRWGKGE